MTPEQKLEAIASLLSQGEIMIGWEIVDVINNIYPEPDQAAEIVSPGNHAGTRIYESPLSGVKRYRNAIARGEKLRAILQGVTLQSAP